MAAMLLAWPGALAIGMSLGLLGSGGSILTVPVLVYLLGQDEKVAIAGSLAIVGLIALAGSIAYMRQKLVDWRNVWLFGLPGMAGTYLGAWISQFVTGAFQLGLFACVMLAASWLMIKPLDLESKAKTAVPRSPYKIVIDGLLVGALTGLVGVGGGFLVVPALVLLGGLSMHRAVATSLIIVAMKSFAGFGKYVTLLSAQNISLDYDIIFMVSLIGIAGSLLGNKVASRIPQEKLKLWFGLFLIGMGLFILYQSVPELLA